jgi:hypothetical protein
MTTLIIDCCVMGIVGCGLVLLALVPDLRDDTYGLFPR